MARGAAAAAQAGDPRFAPSYSFLEAALCVRLPVGTLRVWALGRSYPTTSGEKRTPPMFAIADREERLLSFVNLIEAHVLRGLRTKHDFTMQHVKKALRELGRFQPPDHPLAFEDFLTDGADLFVERFGRLINLNRAGQIAMRETLIAHLKRIDRAGIQGPVRFFPFIRSEDVEGSKTVSISPKVSFGRPVIAGTRITTAEIAGRVNAGDMVEKVAEDFDLTTQQVTDAILFEQQESIA
jgi:uncharacterized protein (DUF433 family)